MTLHVHPVEALFMLINITTLVLTSWALREAIRDHQAVKALNGRAREVATLGDVRRAIERIVKASLLMGVAIPTLFVDNEPQLIGPVGLLMLVPFVMMYGSLQDVRERRVLTAMIASETHEAREASR